MPSPRPFPALKESDVRRLVGTAAFKKARRLWESDAVLSPSVGASEPLLFSAVRDGQATYQVVARHLAGYEFVARCDCDGGDMCAHAVALLLAWAHASFAFDKLEAQPEASDLAARLEQQWHEYLAQSNLSQLRAIARRHQITLRNGERSTTLEHVIKTVSAPDSQLYALGNLNEAQRRVLQSVYLLSDGRPDTLAADVQEALGWASLGDVEGALGELRDWGLVVSIASHWNSSELFTIAPGATRLVANIVLPRCEEVHAFDQPHNMCVEPFSGHTESARIERQTRYIPEMLLLARHLPLRNRPVRPELGQARTQKALRHWPLDVDELVRLQVNPGWLHHAESVLSVPAPAPRFDEASLAQLYSLSGEDALSDFLAHLMPLAAVELAPAGAPALQQIFDEWLRLSTWSELWLPQRERALTVRRSLHGAPLAFSDWLNSLARARRFVVRMLSALAAGQWYDFDSLLLFVHTSRADFLRDLGGSATLSAAWWLERRGQAIDIRDFGAWRATYGRFVEAVLTGPLRWFGAAELAFGAERQLLAFQITPLGYALFHQSPLPAARDGWAPLRLSAELKAGLPLGRSDISAYLTLERLARFEALRDGCASYEFDIEHAHAAFESGLTADDVLAQLEQLAGAPLPEWLCAHWHEWWARYDQVRLYHGLTLIEFADDYVLHELRAQTDLDEHVLFTFGTRLVALRPESADAVARQLTKKGYMPSVE